MLEVPFVEKKLSEVVERGKRVVIVIAESNHPLAGAERGTVALDGMVRRDVYLRRPCEWESAASPAFVIDRPVARDVGKKEFEVKACPHVIDEDKTGLLRYLVPEEIVFGHLRVLTVDDDRFTYLFEGFSHERLS